MASESEGESDTQYAECQTPGCGKKGPKASGVTHFFAVLSLIENYDRTYFSEKRQ